MDLETALRNRRSVRAFLPREVPRATLERIFSEAQRAPSWCNIQPWRAFVASGAKKDELVAGLLAATKDGSFHPDVPFPEEYPEPYGTHRKICGKALYEAMGVERNDMAGRGHAWLRNFAAFDAPHVAICAVDRRFGFYAALDVGCWLQSVLLLATAEGVSTCAQASLSLYPSVARPILGIPDSLHIVFGISIGYEDTDAAANKCRTIRESVEENVSFL